MYDALIIGAGPAGLSTALGLARQTYSAIVFNSNQYRNAFSEHMHNVVTWDHKPPSDFRAAARDNIESRYNTIHFKNAKIVSAAKKDDGTFEAVDDQQNKYQGRKLVLATGVSDILPDIKGFSELWGKRIFHCLFCHGFEDRGAESAGVLGAGFITQPAMILHMARMASPLAKKVTVYCHGNEELTAQVQKEFENKPLTIEPRKITAVEKQGDSVIVQFDDGQTRQEGFLVSISVVANCLVSGRGLLTVEPLVGFCPPGPDQRPFSRPARPGYRSDGLYQDDPALQRDKCSRCICCR